MSGAPDGDQSDADTGGDGGLDGAEGDAPKPDAAGDADDEVSVHSKYLLISGAYGSKASHQNRVWTGSHNYTGPALRRNDEVLLKIRQDEVDNAFLGNWSHMRTLTQTLR